MNSVPNRTLEEAVRDAVGAIRRALSASERLRFNKIGKELRAGLQQADECVTQIVQVAKSLDRQLQELRISRCVEEQRPPLSWTVHEDRIGFVDVHGNKWLLRATGDRHNPVAISLEEHGG